MRRFLLSFLTLAPALAYGASEGRFILSSGQSGVLTEIQQRNLTSLSVTISALDYVSDLQDRYAVYLPDEFGISRGAYLGPDNAVLPTITRLIAIPFDSDPGIRITSETYSDVDNVTLAGAEAEDIEALTPPGNMNLNRTPDVVRAEVAGEMRDLRLYSITFSPVQYYPQEKRLRVLTQLSLEVNHLGSQITKYPDRISEAFLPIYRAVLDNPAVFDPILPTRGAYWIIYPDSFASDIQPLAAWKKAKGFSVETIAKSQLGSNTYLAIKSYLLSRFDTCLVKPDYVVIVADVTMPNSYGITSRPYSNPNGDGDSDNYYSFLHGNDYFPELLIGRISIDNSNDLSAYMNKLFTYERTPYMGETGWYHRATVVAGSDGYSFLSPRLTKLWCREIMMDSGYTRVDTFFTDWSGIPPEEISASINNGVSFVNYRGYGYADEWIPPEYSSTDIQQLTNGPRFPVMTSIVCATGDFNDAIDVCFGETWIRANNKGGAGFIGNTNHYAHTRWTNAIDVGIYWGWFAEGALTLAQGELMGKMNLYNAFPDDRAMNGQVDLYFNTYNDLGDPELNCWTGIPQAMSVIHEDSVSLGQNHLLVHVESPDGSPIEGATVCCLKTSEVFVTGFTGSDGNFDFALQPQTEGRMNVTVTSRGHIPYEGSVYYYASPVVVSYLSHVVDDDSSGESSGDSDGICNPSETIELSLALQNYGQSQTAHDVSCTIASDSPFIEIVRSSASFGDIAPGGFSLSGQPYLLRASPDAPDGAQATITLSITDYEGHLWTGAFVLSIDAAMMIVDSVFVDDSPGNNRIDPGETVELVVTARNAGSKALLGAMARLRSADPQVTITDSSAVFDNCQPGASFNNNADRFVVTVNPWTYVGHVINFELEFEGLGPQIATAAFNQQVGQVASDDPIGPDAYGYYCFDNTDTSYSNRPTFSWVDINTLWPYVSLGDDDIATIDLPFTVRYYGQDFDQVSICDNGYVTMGETWYASFYNTPIPAPQDAKAMIAPFWDDFEQVPLRVYYFHDSVNGWFVIGWRNAMTRDYHLAQTFEILILDEAVWPTVTGDNDIIFQYNLVQSPFYNSTGICSPDRRIGLEYVFDGTYPPGAPEIISGRAIKFTTGAAGPVCAYTPGDINDNGAANGVDVSFGVNYFKGFGDAPPIACADCPNPGQQLFGAGDVNGNCQFNGVDISYFVNYLKGVGPALNYCQECPPSAILNHISKIEIGGHKPQLKAFGSSKGIIQR